MLFVTAEMAFENAVDQTCSAQDDVQSHDSHDSPIIFDYEDEYRDVRMHLHLLRHLHCFAVFCAVSSTADAQIICNLCALHTELEHMIALKNMSLNPAVAEDWLITAFDQGFLYDSVTVLAVVCEPCL